MSSATADVKFCETCGKRDTCTTICEPLERYLEAECGTPATDVLSPYRRDKLIFIGMSDLLDRAKIVRWF